MQRVHRGAPDEGVYWKCNYELRGVFRVSGQVSVELTHHRPQYWIPQASLYSGAFYVQVYWEGGCDLDQVTAFRAKNSLAGVITSQPDRVGSKLDYPFMYQLNDDRVGGVGETMEGDVAKVRDIVERLCVGVYNNDPFMPLGKQLQLAAAVVFPGHPAIVVRPGGLTASACTLMRIDFAPNGVQVLHDVVPVDHGGWTSPFVALMGAWCGAMWGSDK